MNKGRWILSGAVIGFLLALTLGFVHEGGSSFGDMMGVGDMHAGMMGSGDMRTSMEQMHRSEQMERIHEAMPEELRVACEALHEEMSTATRDMPSGGDMPMDPGDHAAHHPTGN